MSGMFNGCNSLTNLDLSGFNTSNVINMSSMFNYCSMLERLDIRNFDFSKVTSSSSIFGSSTASSKIPVDCLIIVKDDSAKEWVLNVRNDLTNVKTVAEL